MTLQQIAGKDEEADTSGERQRVGELEERGGGRRERGREGGGGREKTGLYHQLVTLQQIAGKDEEADTSGERRRVGEERERERWGRGGGETT